MRIVKTGPLASLLIVKGTIILPCQGHKRPDCVCFRSTIAPADPPNNFQWDFVESPVISDFARQRARIRYFSPAQSFQQTTQYKYFSLQRISVAKIIALPRWTCVGWFPLSHSRRSQAELIAASAFLLADLLLSPKSHQQQN